ncbi:Hypothetical predicted protein [Mytilus galloprovincialis]|uniref:Uncharacterized protein n=1 Tax=Mytilus galloprovincialis TaxID=29158 RepID=A0A8B6ELJ5_MYTGA|nr:Hypothetical predicted protein [Mytilus galloprovincialis]
MPEKIFTTRPWTQHPLSPGKLYRQQRADIKTPVINTYAKQLQRCDRLYEKVAKEFGKTRERFPRIHDNNAFSYDFQQRPIFTKSAPGTFHYDDPNAIQRLEWSLTNQFLQQRHHTEYMDYRRHHHDFADDSRSVSEYSDHFELDPFQLSDILHRRGLRKPVMVRYDKNGVEIRKSKIKIRPNNGALPTNPSAREKIKGRARLDYEMANMRAVAFCERQAQRKFRTASAITRNRDVELVEEDFLERINNENNNNDNDDTGSVIMSMDKEELFERIDKWIDGVNEALGQSSNSTSKVDFQDKT